MVPPNRRVLAFLMQDHREDRSEHREGWTRWVFSGLLIGELAILRSHERFHQFDVVSVLQRRAGDVDRVDPLLVAREHRLELGDAGRRWIAPLTVVAIIAKKRRGLG